MPSQIVVLPASTLDAVLSHSSSNLQVAICSRHMQPKVWTLPCGERVLRIEIDRQVFCPELSNALHDDVYAILLTASISTPGLVQPVTLSDAVTRQVLDEVEAALIGLHLLTGHDKMAVASAISWARTGAPITLPPVSRMCSADEATRLARAKELQAVLQPALIRIDRKLARYAGFVRGRSLETAVVRLGLQADLGAALRLVPSPGGLRPTLRRRHRRGRFTKLWQSTTNALGAFQFCLDRIHRQAPEGGNWLAGTTLPALSSALLNGLTPAADSWVYRSTSMRIRSVSGKASHELAFPADAVPKAEVAFASGFDARLWTDIHPLVRAGMAHIELMAIHPFGDGNGRLGRLLLQAMLIENAVPGLPLEAIFTWNRDAYLERVDAAIRKADLLAFMQWLLKAVDKAIELGRHFTRSLKEHRQEIFPGFIGAGGRFAAIASEHAASMVLGPDEQVVERALMDPNAFCEYLLAAGLDRVSTGFAIRRHPVHSAWYSPVARHLLAAPPAKI